METISAETLKTNFVVTSEALVQIALIHEHDYTVTDKVFRLKIDGKECDGFRYFTGFTEKDPSDLTLSYTCDQGPVSISIDPFTAYYCQDGKLDYVFEPISNEEGFMFENSNEKTFHGKFFKNTDLLPPGAKA